MDNHGTRPYEAVSASRFSDDTEHRNSVTKKNPPSYHSNTIEVPSPFTPRSTEKLPLRRRRRLRSSPFKFWTWEIISLILTIGLIVAIVAILSHFEGRPLPDWPFGINLSTLVALLSTILRTLMLVAVAEALGQLKWTWFSHPAQSSSPATPRPLHDFHVFDRASRGILGSMRLLRTVKHRNVLAVIGSLVTILSLAIGPFTQQALKNVSCQRAVASQNSTVPAAHFMGISDSFQGSFSRGPGWYALPNDMKGAMISGLINPTGNDSAISPTCQTGNCTFQEEGNNGSITYSSIGMCSKCIETTSLAFANSTVSNTSIDWELPNGMQIELAVTMPILNVTTNDNMSWASSLFTDDYNLHAIQALANVTVFSFTTSPCYNESGTTHCPRNITNDYGDEVMGGAWDVVGTTCALYPCMKNYHGAVEEGTFIEKIVSTELASWNWPGSSDEQRYWPLDYTEVAAGNWTALKSPCFIDDVEYSKSNNFSDVPRIETRNFTLVHSDGGYYNAPEECVYTLSAQYVMGMYDWMTQTLFTGTCAWPDDTSIVDLAEPDCSNQFWLSPLWNTRNASFDSISKAMDEFSTAVTNKFRTDGQMNWYQPWDSRGDIAEGMVYETTVCVAVNWEWLLMPIVLAAMSTLLLGAIILKTVRDDEQQVWKSSVLPLLFYGPGPGRLADDEDNDAAVALAPAAADLDALSKESRRTNMAFRNGPGAGFVEKGESCVRDDGVEVDSLMEVPR